MEKKHVLMHKSKKSLKSLPNRPKAGLIVPLALMLLLSACASQPMNVEPIAPDYSGAFLVAVHNEWKAGIVGENISAALADWMVFAGL